MNVDCWAQLSTSEPLSALLRASGERRGRDREEQGGSGGGRDGGVQRALDAAGDRHPEREAEKQDSRKDRGGANVDARDEGNAGHDFPNRRPPSLPTARALVTDTD